jgi:putative drug exporter of the RND superfamily
MLTLARFSIRRPRVALAAWLVAGVVLAVIGLGVSSSLSPSVTVVPGTQSSRAVKLSNATFGPTQQLPILLEGPKAALNRQGPELVVALTKRPHTRVLSAWDAGSASALLRPSPRAAMLIVSVDRTEQQVAKHDWPQIHRLVNGTIKAPVRSYITGQAVLDQAVKDASINNLRQTELIALGILLVLLLLGLRSAVAAVIVTAVGAVSTLAGFGEVALLGRLLHLDPVGVTLGTMTGLTLGVGFSLLILDRFHREELPDGLHARDAATAAVRDLETTGKAVLVAGTAVLVALALVAAIGPTELMISLGTGMLTCAMFAIGGAVVVMPAALVLLGGRLDALSFPAPAILARAWSRLLDGGNWVTRNAVFAGLAATVLLAVIAVPVLALKTGPQDISQLPSKAPAKIAFEQISRVMGPGFPTPYNIIIDPNHRPITDPAVLASINRLQNQIAVNKTVDSISGPAEIYSTADQLKAFGPGQVNAIKVSKQSKKDLLRLINGLGQAGAGSAQLQSGLQQAASGATQLHGGSGQASSGAVRLHAGLAQAKAGSGQLSSGLSQALSGAVALKNGAGQALSGASQLAAGLGKGAPQVKAGLPAVNLLATDTATASSQAKAAQGQTQATESSVDSALASLGSMTSGKSDARYADVVSALQAASGSAAAANHAIADAATNANASAFIASGVKSQVNALAPQLTAAASGAAQLEAGIAQLRHGNAQLATGLSQLSGGGSQLHSGLGQLTDGAGQLQAGLALLNAGTGQLASGLAPAPAGAGQLVTGLGEMQAGVVKSRGQIPSTKALETLVKQSPGIFSSGYFVLSAVSGARAADRNAASFLINLVNGGTAGQITIWSKYKDSDPRTLALGDRLVALSHTYAKHYNAQVALGGPAGAGADLTTLTRDRIPLAIAAIAIALTLILAIAVRAILLPAVSAAFSLLVSAATFGVLQLLFGGSNPPLGGPGWLDPATVLGIFTVVFSIAVVFSTLLLMRTREAYVNGDGSRGSVAIGLRETAAPATGAGLVMIAALIPFAATDLTNVREFGIGVAMAILLEVLLVRPVLLPAAEAVLGRFGWWPTKTPARSQRSSGDAPAPSLPDRALPSIGAQP